MLRRRAKLYERSLRRATKEREEKRNASRKRCLPSIAWRKAKTKIRKLYLSWKSYQLKQRKPNMQRSLYETRRITRNQTSGHERAAIWRRIICSMKAKAAAKQHENEMNKAAMADCTHFQKEKAGSIAEGITWKTSLRSDKRCSRNGRKQRKAKWSRRDTEGRLRCAEAETAGEGGMRIKKYGKNRWRTTKKKARQRAKRWDEKTNKGRAAKGRKKGIMNIISNASGKIYQHSYELDIRHLQAPQKESARKRGGHAKASERANMAALACERWRNLGHMNM